MNTCTLTPLTFPFLCFVLFILVVYLQFVKKMFLCHVYYIRNLQNMNIYYNNNKDVFTFNEDIVFVNVKMRCVCHIFRNIIFLKDIMLKFAILFFCVYSGLSLEHQTTYTKLSGYTRTLTNRHIQELTQANRNSQATSTTKQLYSTVKQLYGTIKQLVKPSNYIERSSNFTLLSSNKYNQATRTTKQLVQPSNYMVQSSNFTVLSCN